MSGDGVKTDHSTLKDHMHHFDWWALVAGNLATMLASTGLITPIAAAAAMAALKEIDVVKHLSDAGAVVPPAAPVEPPQP